MLESAIGDGSQQFRFQQKVSKTRAVDADVGPFRLVFLFSVAIFSGSYRLRRVCLVIRFVVDEILSHNKYINKQGVKQRTSS